jgi:hypothetical protein
MELTGLLSDGSQELLEEAVQELRQARLEHHGARQPRTIRERLTTLLDLTFRCLGAGRADPMVDYTTQIADERVEAGDDLLELQTALNVLEEALWRSMQPAEVARALSLVSVALGMGQDALARACVSVAAEPLSPQKKSLTRSSNR